MIRQFSLTVNGSKRSTTTDEDRPLLDVLREDFHLTGTKFGCGEGECGACTVLVGGVPKPSCITPIKDVHDASIQTIEGLSRDAHLHHVQQAFLDQQAMQCGYCVPGHIMTAVAFVRVHAGASREEIVATMSAHICRCCTLSEDPGPRRASGPWRFAGGRSTSRNGEPSWPLSRSMIGRPKSSATSLANSFHIYSRPAGASSLARSALDC